MINDENESKTLMNTELKQRVLALEAEIAQLKQQWPQHSVPPTMLMELEGLEEELDVARQQLSLTTHLSKAP